MARDKHTNADSGVYCGADPGYSHEREHEAMHQPHQHRWTLRPDQHGHLEVMPHASCLICGETPEQVANAPTIQRLTERVHHLEDKLVFVGGYLMGLRMRIRAHERLDGAAEDLTWVLEWLANADELPEPYRSMWRRPRDGAEPIQPYPERDTARDPEESRSHE